MIKSINNFPVLQLSSKLFIELDSSLKAWRSCDRLDFEHSAITTTHQAHEDALVFLNSRRLLRLFLEMIPTDIIKTCTLIVTESLTRQKLDLELLEQLPTETNILISKNHHELFMSSARMVYDMKFSHLEPLADGRTLLNAQIDSFADVSKDAFIGEGVVVEKGAVVMPGAHIMSHSYIGENTIIHPGVVMYPYTYVGKGVRIHANTTLGTDGFGYQFKEGKHHKVWHSGSVCIEDDVEIGTFSAVDSGTFQPTLVGEGTKIDNFCQISHNAIIGKHNIFCGRSGVSGSAITEDFVFFGAGAGAAPGVYLKVGTQVASCAIISENTIWGPKETIAGHPARPLKKWLKAQAILNKLVDDQGKNTSK